jgi:hypothetical protein
LSAASRRRRADQLFARAVFFQHLLALRDQRRVACPDPRVDAIVIDRLKAQMVSTLRYASTD